MKKLPKALSVLLAFVMVTATCFVCGKGDESHEHTFSFGKTLYEYAEGSKTSSWAEFEVSGDKITVYVKNASSGSVVTQKTWGIKKVA